MNIILYIIAGSVAALLALAAVWVASELLAHLAYKHRYGSWSWSRK